MKSSNTKWKIVRHVLALVSSTGFLAIVPVILYVALIVWSDDLGGPLNLVIIPLGSALIGFAISLVVFLPLGLLAERFGFRRWLHITGVSVGSLTAVVLSAWIYIGITGTESRWPGLVLAGSGLCLYLVGGFFVYLCCLGVSGERFHDRIARRREAG